MTGVPKTTKFRRTLETRGKALKDAFENLLVVLSGEDRSGKQAAASRLHNEVGKLADLLNEADLPSWQRKLHHATLMYTRDPNAPHRLLAALVEVRSQVLSEDLAELAEPDAGGGDWDQVLTDFVEEAGLPGLFDRLIVELESILETGEISDAQAKEAIGRLLRMLRRHRGAPYSKLRLLYIGSSKFFKNYVGEVASPAAKAAIKTFREMREIIEQAENSITVSPDGYLPPPHPPKLLTSGGIEGAPSVGNTDPPAAVSSDHPAA